MEDIIIPLPNESNMECRAIIQEDDNSSPMYKIISEIKYTEEGSVWEAAGMGDHILVSKEDLLPIAEAMIKFHKLLNF